MQDDTEQNLIRKVIKSEVSWIVFIVVAVWAVVAKIVIPLNTIQDTQANIQVTLNEIKSINVGFDNRITDNANNIIVIQQEIKNLTKEK